MGIVKDLFSGSGGGSFDSAVVGAAPAGAVPQAPRIPDVVQPSAEQVQQARLDVKRRAQFLGKTRGGTLVRRARSVAPTTSALLGRVR